MNKNNDKQATAFNDDIAASEIPRPAEAYVMESTRTPPGGVQLIANPVEYVLL